MSYEDALKIAKTMKRNYIFVTPTRMYGLDIEKGALSIIDIESDVQIPFAGEVSSILNEKKKESYLKKNTPTFLNEYKQLTDDMYLNFWDEPKVMGMIMSAYSNLNTLLNGRFARLIYSIDNLEKNEEFMKNTYGIKTDDGYRKYIFENYYLDCFSKVHCISKSDKVALNVYDVDPYSLVYEFFIDKKKYVVKEYFRVRKLHHYMRVDIGE